MAACAPRMIRPRESGLTLIELMVTLSIISIIVALAGPPYRQFIQNQRLSAASSELQRALSLARAEALTRARRVTVCRSTDNTTCNASANSLGWAQGWIVFVDNDGAASVGVRDATATPAETILLVQQGPLVGVSNASASTGLGNYISFTGTGFAQLADGTFQSGTIAICDSRGDNFARPVIITGTGMPRVGAAPANCASP